VAEKTITAFIFCGLSGAVLCSAFLRAAAYRISIGELPGYYAKRILLNETILRADKANAVFIFAGSFLSKRTGNMINVDGGAAAVFMQ